MQRRSFSPGTALALGRGVGSHPGMPVMLLVPPPPSPLPPPSPSPPSPLPSPPSPSHGGVSAPDAVA